MEKKCVLSTDDGNAVFIINDTKMYVPAVTLSKEDKKDFTEQQKKGFQRSIYRSTKNYLLLYSRFKVGDRVRISKFKNIFAKGYAPNWCSEIFIVNKVNDTVPYTYNLKDLNDEEIIGSFYDKELQKTKLL